MNSDELLEEIQYLWNEGAVFDEILDLIVEYGEAAAEELGDL